MKYNIFMDEKELTLDYIAGTNTYVYQRKDMFRINTDTAQLARFMKINENEKVLDVGTNNGALLLHANQYKPASLHGIDIQEEACEIARFNMEKFAIANVRIECMDFKTYTENGFDVIVSNPPYFKLANNRVPEESMRSIARHEMYLQLEELVAKVASCLHHNGRFYMVHRADRISDIITTCTKYNLYIKTIQFIYDTQCKDAKGVLVEAILQANEGSKVLEPIYV